MGSLAPHAKLHKVAVVGSGNWGSAIAKIVAENVYHHPDVFEPEVKMWVYEETVSIPKDSHLYDNSSPLSTSPQPLTKLINTYHENLKYLPNIRLPTNLIANPSLTDTTRDATILIFNLPHQFIDGICKQMKGHYLPYARGISCIKGVSVSQEVVKLFSDSIGEQLGIYVGALSGANIATEIAQEKFSGSTIGYDPPKVDSQQPTPEASHTDLTKLTPLIINGDVKPVKESTVKLAPLPADYPPLDHALIRTLFWKPYFRVKVVSDVAGVSLGGALKNIIALAAGFVEGLGWGDNAKAEIIRLGLDETAKFGTMFFGDRGFLEDTIYRQSCGTADMITSCNGGRNARCARLSVERKQSIEEVEASELNGQKLQGTLTAREVNAWLRGQKKEDEFPLMTAVFEILEGRKEAKDLQKVLELVE